MLVIGLGLAYSVLCLYRSVGPTAGTIDDSNELHQSSALLDAVLLGERQRREHCSVQQRRTKGYGGQQIMPEGDIANLWGRIVDGDCGHCR